MAEAVPVSPFPGGLHVLALTQRKRHAAQWAAFGVIALFAMGNAVAMIKRAERLAHQARTMAVPLCATYPDVDDAVLKDMHQAGADAARERLRVVRGLRFPPFDTCKPDATARQARSHAFVLEYLAVGRDWRAPGDSARESSALEP